MLSIPMHRSTSSSSLSSSFPSVCLLLCAPSLTVLYVCVACACCVQYSAFLATTLLADYSPVGRARLFSTEPFFQMLASSLLLLSSSSVSVVGVAHCVCCVCCRPSTEALTKLSHSLQCLPQRQTGVGVARETQWSTVGVLLVLLGVVGVVFLEMC